MKNIKLSITGALILILVFSCSSNKQAQLSKLKQKQTVIADKIRILEDELNSEKKDSLNPEKFRFVGLKEVTSNPFDHYIRVQGKLDGDQNAAVFAEAPGTVAAKYADVGQNVVKGQVLAQIDDQQYRSQLDGLDRKSVV
jgi:multidrug efflux pump subunit AcrA (membrane-fusion protein)